MPTLPRAEHIPADLLNSLRVKDLDPVLSYAKSIYLGHVSRACYSKSDRIDVLRSILKALYASRNRQNYENVIGSMYLASTLRPSTLSTYTKYQWHGSSEYLIPISGPWVEFFNRAGAFSATNRSNTPSVTPIASRVHTPSGIQNAQFAQSPSAAAAAVLSTANKTNKTGFSIDNLIFGETDFLSPVQNLEKPIICTESPSRRASKTFTVRFTHDQLDMLLEDASRPGKCKYGVYLYMCAYADAASVTTGVPKRPAPISYPRTLGIFLNAAAVPTTAVEKATANKQPLSLTEHIKKTTDYSNRISISYSTSARWVVALVLAKEYTFQTIATEIRKTNFVTADKVRQRFFKASSTDGDDDLISTGALVSLKCPLGLCQITTPTRSQYCQHSQCFDCETFLQLNKNMRSWKCPVCSIAIKTWRELIVDGFFEEILKGTSSSDEQVYIESNGVWKKKDAAAAAYTTGNMATPNKNSRPLEIDLDDDTAAISDGSVSLAPMTSTNKRQRTEYVDLTLDSDSDENTSIASEVIPAFTQEELELIIAAETTTGSTTGEAPTSEVSQHIISMLTRNQTSSSQSSARTFVTASTPAAVSTQSPRRLSNERAAAIAPASAPPQNRVSRILPRPQQNQGSRPSLPNSTAPARHRRAPQNRRHSILQNRVPLLSSSMPDTTATIPSSLPTPILTSIPLTTAVATATIITPTPTTAMTPPAASSISPPATPPAAPADTAVGHNHGVTRLTPRAPKAQQPSAPARLQPSRPQPPSALQRRSRQPSVRIIPLPYPNPATVATDTVLASNAPKSTSTPTPTPAPTASAAIITTVSLPPVSSAICPSISAPATPSSIRPSFVGMSPTYTTLFLNSQPTGTNGASSMTATPGDYSYAAGQRSPPSTAR
ncbi:E3 SUMO-protein ligase pli1 [Coemansia spiralis]|uniref:E3 SUMO-protein ligase pli1 n=2 Tax=Coemansia TaxID=4863 RepID=A0A9W8G990_9FUNG|nr:E3 SUMO-protein ligase pli1 [Coemansia umbellata]KAJ2626032.1 E3 SUMO-protein ligase pli1 [Coemansia sp. RSA 1358]KAJ2678614.1 E3 SUMO-protein ligase pli1 [Coemansia spiralis]